jgi:hypothetical protein
VWIDRTVTAFSANDVTTGTKSPGFDRQFHELIPLKVSYDWEISNHPDGAKCEKFKRDIVEYEFKLKQYYGSKQKDRKLILNPAYINYN